MPAQPMGSLHASAEPHPEERRSNVITTLIVALSLTSIASAPCQASLMQSPVATTATATNDVRHVIRETSGDATSAEAPPGMVPIAGGETVLGTDLDDVSKLGQRDVVMMTQILAETPRHSVTVDSFFMDTTEVTNLQWKVFLDATRRKPSDTLIEFGWPDGEIPAGQEFFPVSNVNIPEINEYLQWCGKRLPTEEEWTRAARGDDTRTYPWGDRWATKSCQSGLTLPQRAVEVGSYPSGASPYGVLDMAGNVFEWVDSPFSAFDGFKPMPFGKGRQALSLTPEFNSTVMIIKGGGFFAVKQGTRVDTRLGMTAADSDASLGFRGARSLRPGMEAIRHGYMRLLPPAFSKLSDLDTTDIFGREINSYDEARSLITGYRFMAFAHRAPYRGAPLSRIRRDAREEPLPLGVLVTSEPLLMTDMLDEAEQPLVLPAGEYSLFFKSEGESKQHRKDRVDAEREARKNGGRGSGEDEEETEEGAGADISGAAVPWPGIRSIHDVETDVEFDQESDVFLLKNANSVVVGWIKTGDIQEAAVAPVKAVSPDHGNRWDISFSLDTLSRGKGPRFTLPLTLQGAGLR
jgi:formylglycine-generating enzyme required for sulfatase activity